MSETKVTDRKWVTEDGKAHYDKGSGNCISSSVPHWRGSELPSVFLTRISWGIWLGFGSQQQAHCAERVRSQARGTCSQAQGPHSMLISTGCLLPEVRKQQPPSWFSKGLQSSAVGNGEISTVVQTLNVRSLGAGRGRNWSSEEPSRAFSTKSFQ